MGLLKLLHLSHLLCANPRATRTSTTIPRPSLAVQGGVFDVPHEKCLPPDRGRSSFQVTAERASTPISPSPCIHFSNSNPFFNADYRRESTNLPPTPPPDGERINSNDYMHARPNLVAAVNIPMSRRAAAQTLATPPLTPEDNVRLTPAVRADSDALDFLMTLFPRDGMRAVQYAKGVTISTGSTLSFAGIVLALPGQEKALYVFIDAKSASGVSLRESIIALMDLASEIYDCWTLVLALEKRTSTFPSLLHSFMYVGGEVVTKPIFPLASKLLLIGFEL